MKLKINYQGAVIWFNDGTDGGRNLEVADGCVEVAEEEVELARARLPIKEEGKHGSGSKKSAHVAGSVGDAESVSDVPVPADGAKEGGAGATP